MTRLLHLFRKLAFPVAIGVALSFGASQAVGQMGTQRSCPWDPPDHLGECESPTQCNTLCVEEYDGYVGLCDQNNCCGCFHK